MIQKFEKAGISLTENMQEKLVSLTDFMLLYNQKVNLTRITEPEEIIEKHYIDSILPFTFLDVPRRTSLIDVGTGAGFPAIPLKIYRDDLKITLLDSLNKRISYLNQLCEKLNIEAETLHARSEEAGINPTYRERFDFATARAVANLAVLSEYCLPFVKVGGFFIALKAGGAGIEIKAAKTSIKTLGGEISEIKDYSLPSGDSRTVIVIKKVSQTSPKYPRNSGIIAKKPL